MIGGRTIEYNSFVVERSHILLYRSAQLSAEDHTGSICTTSRTNRLPTQQTLFVHLASLYHPGSKDGGGVGPEEGVGGLDWLKQAVTSGKDASGAAITIPDGVLASGLSGNAASIEPPPAAEAGANGSGGNLDWLTAATSSAQASVQHSHASMKAARKASVTVAAPGGWLASGTLGVSTENNSDEDVGRSGGQRKTGVAGGQTPKGTPAAVGAGAALVNGPGGWLSSGALGISTDDDADQDADGGSGSHGRENGRPNMATEETQTEDNIEGIVKGKAEPKLPPWARRWTPAPEPEVVPDSLPEHSPDSEGGAENMVSRGFAIFGRSQHYYPFVPFGEIRTVG